MDMTSIVNLASKMQERVIDLHMNLCRGILEEFRGTFVEDELRSVDTLATLLILGTYGIEYIDSNDGSDDDWIYSVVDDDLGDKDSGLELLASRLPFFLVKKNTNCGYLLAFSFKTFCAYSNNSSMKACLEAVILYEKEVRARLTDALVQRGNEIGKQGYNLPWLFEDEWKDNLSYLFYYYVFEGNCSTYLYTDDIPEDLVSLVCNVLGVLDDKCRVQYSEKDEAIYLSISDPESIYESTSDLMNRNLVLNMDDYLAKSYKFIVMPEGLK